MGIAATYPKPRTGKSHPANPVFPHLLRGMVIDRPSQAWCADIAYIPTSQGFGRLVAVTDWCSRRAPSWWVSNTLMPISA